LVALLDRSGWCDVSRINDVGGQSGFGPVPPPEHDEPAFHADWEARVFALNATLLRRGVYALDELRDAIERMPPRDYLAASYYERWLTAIETLVREKGVLLDESNTGHDDQEDAAVTRRMRQADDPADAATDG
jgi:nitrile hydratase